MPQYWLKPLGVTHPAEPMPDDWTARFGLDPFELTTGPAKIQNPPQMGRGDRVLFHAVMHTRVFAEGEIVGKAKWTPDGPGGKRWPWVYPCRVDIWVSLIRDGPRTTEVAPKRVVGRIQAGGDYANLSRDEYEDVLASLLKSPTVKKRPQSEDSVG